MKPNLKAIFIPPRDVGMDEAVKAANQARNSAREAARLVEARDPKLARELNEIADQLSRRAKRMWSL